jgi:phenylacetate-coenzyme A ligase PaaK-like adenylate-forming protein
MAEQFLNAGIRFFERALLVFNHQREHNFIYRDYLAAINFTKVPIHITDFPFLPIAFFKTHQVVAALPPFDEKFKSSGTTSANTTAWHHIKDISLYQKSFLQSFEQFYGPVQEFCVLGLLPSYLEQGQSSLVYMVNEFMQRSKFKTSRTYLYEHEELASQIQFNIQNKIPTILFGVTYALLDFAEKFSMELPDYIIIMETGGMKGRKKEMTRNEVHKTLQESFGENAIHSEYGMTELLSQAYSKGNGIYYPPTQMRILVRDRNDPFSVELFGRGVLNIIDLANYHSCSFLATDDIGIVADNGSFEILGRLDIADIRGCSLLSV